LRKLLKGGVKRLILYNQQKEIKMRNSTLQTAGGPLDSKIISLAEIRKIASLSIIAIDGVIIRKKLHQKISLFFFATSTIFAAHHVTAAARKTELLSLETAIFVFTVALSAVCVGVCSSRSKATRTAIVGTSAEAVAIAAQLREFEDVSVVRLYSERTVSNDNTHNTTERYDIATLERDLISGQIDEVVLALPASASRRAEILINSIKAYDCGISITLPTSENIFCFGLNRHYNINNITLICIKRAKNRFFMCL
jgi:FlaA1/EpsC-like NDP-sugar epimerase